MKVKLPVWLLLTMALTLCVVIAISLPNYSRVASYGGRQYSMTLDSGVDKKSARNAESTASSGEDYSGDRDGMLAEIAPSTPGEGSYQAEARPQDGGEVRANAGATREALAVQLAHLSQWIIPSAYAQDHQLDERYIVRSGECTLQVDDYPKAAAALDGIAKRYGGMVSSTQSQREEDDSLSGQVTLRVPSAKFAQAWAETLACGKILSESVKTEDVSRSYLAQVSQMKNLVTEQAALQKMLDEALAVQRARGLGEGYKILLDTQERLFAVNGELQSAEDSLNALADSITRSTITVNLTQKLELPAQVNEKFRWGIGTTAAQAYLDLKVSLRRWINGWVYFLITCWTWLIPLVLAFFVLRTLYRRYAKARGILLPALVTTTASGAGTQATPGDEPPVDEERS